MVSASVDAAPEPAVWCATAAKHPRALDQEIHTAGPPGFSQILQLKRCGPEPLYYQLAQSVEEAVASGRIPRGTRLLPEKQMARELRIAISTVRRAWEYLERKGMLSRTRQVGTFIR